MGLTYKLFQKMAYGSLEWGREEGIRIDKQLQRDKKTKELKQIRDICKGKELNRQWELLMEECWELDQTLNNSTK